jgi:mannose-1-phosphate guanylyltransferase
MTANRTNEQRIVPIILSGGMGTRLWPLSRGDFPKQFLKLNDDKLSLFQETLARIADRTKFAAPIVICNNKHRFLVADQLQQCNIEDAHILLEPEARNTAPAISAVCAYIEATSGHARALVLPSDHIITNDKAFTNAIQAGNKSAAAGKLIIFGITPTHAEAGFGYIKAADKFDEHSYNVESFVEKPDQQTAQTYIESGNYSWNSGIFLFSTSLFLQELRIHAPDVYKHSLASVAHREENVDFIRLNAQAFAACPSISIDYAVMEHSKNVAVVPVSCGWNDAGSWQALWNVKEKDDNNNFIHGESFPIDTHNCYIASDEGTHVATLGVENLIIVSTKDAILVAHKDRTQDVKHMVDHVRSQTPELVAKHREVYRPWGKFDRLDSGKRHQVKRLTIKPKAAISTQTHMHRCEHWVIVSGQAHITHGEKNIVVNENESIFIPAETKHRIENKGAANLEIIEVQSGAYLGEDDIIRFDDNYGRKSED